MRNGTALVAILGLIALAILAGGLIGRTWAVDPLRQVEAQAAAEWAAAWRPYQVALTLAAGLVGIGALAAAVVVGYRYLDNRARTIYADRNGVMPAVILRPGEVLADAGALPAPLQLGPAGPTFPTLPAADLPRLQGAASQGAAMTRAMRAWASRDPGQREATPAPAILPQLAPGEYPPVEVLTGDPAHVYRLLEQGEGEHGA